MHHLMPSELAGSSIQSKEGIPAFDGYQAIRAFSWHYLSQQYFKLMTVIIGIWPSSTLV